MGGYNHYSWCNCGWCVKDRGYRYTSPKTKAVTNTKIVKKSTNEYHYIPKIETYKSFTIPNVYCNCCGLPIFFYQSPYGGRVFFEELGPPWIKHCCEPKCCESTKENIPNRIIHRESINLDKKSTWEKDAWIPCIIVDEIIINTHIKKIIVKSAIDMCEYTFFIQKDFLKFELQNDFILFLKKQNELMYEISFYLDKEYKISVSRNSNSYYLQFFKFINNSFNLLKDKDISSTKLAKLFFETLNIKSLDVEKKEQLLNAIIEHPNSKKCDMDEVYYFIKRQGFNKFKKNIIKKYSFYNDCTIDFLISLENIYIPLKFKQSLIKQGKIKKFLMEISKLKWINLKIDSTLKDYQYQFNLIKIIFLPKKEKSKIIKRKIILKPNRDENQENVNIEKAKNIEKNKSNLKKKKDTSNLKPNRKEWKGISINKPKKKIQLTFIEKDNNL